MCPGSAGRPVPSPSADYPPTPSPPRAFSAPAQRWRCCPWNRGPPASRLRGSRSSRDRSPGRTGGWGPATAASQGEGPLGAGAARAGAGPADLRTPPHRPPPRAEASWPSSGAAGGGQGGAPRPLLSPLFPFAPPPPLPSPPPLCGGPDGPSGQLRVPVPRSRRLQAGRAFPALSPQDAPTSGDGRVYDPLLNWGPAGCPRGPGGRRGDCPAAGHVRGRSSGGRDGRWTGPGPAGRKGTSGEPRAAHGPQHRVCGSQQQSGLLSM